MGNRNGILDAQLDFAGKNPNVIFEFKTKTKNIDYFLAVDLPPNIMVCWSLNPQSSLTMRSISQHRLKNV
jgi:spore photoproduct lyase